MKNLEISALFAALGDTYDEVRHRMVPCFDDFYGMAAELAALRLGPAPRILDLGAGTGMLSAVVAGLRSDAHFVLVDGASELLAQAERRLDGRCASCTTITQDMREPIPGGPYDAVVSALAIHHLEDSDKHDLFKRVHHVLKPGGVFVNAEQVAGTTERVQKLDHSLWLERARAAGATEADLEAAHRRMEHDRPTTVGTQLEWLSEIGFQDADCFYKNYFFAVFAGWRS
ncbi:class I SAM-dependent methyltransferase [Actinoallomurus sp. NPDC052274]|uniref:class I SAM-dependent methyltransferase n=1 Tax=Actinoallomurus sp. NPDC052274 TaxID=3155420 RepID=UPI0034449530